MRISETLDNDGYTDFYLGTGAPSYDAIAPNAMYRNDEGNGFQDVTFSGGFGHLQKGHGVSFGTLTGTGTKICSCRSVGSSRVMGS